MKTLSGMAGSGVIVPSITYVWVPLREAPDAGLVKASGPEAPAATGSQSTRAMNRGATRILGSIRTANQQ
jgi:hypothetical protein